MDEGLIGNINKQIAGEWTQTLKAAARRNGLGDDVAPVRGWLGGAMLIACIRQLGGRCIPVEPFHGWILREAHDCEYRCIDAAAPELAVEGARIGDFHGVVRIDLDGETFLALRTDEPVQCEVVERTLVVVGPTLGVVPGVFLQDLRLVLVDNAPTP